MDSDVQDVFARHHVEEKSTAERLLGQPNFFDSKPAASPGMASGLPQQRQQQPIGMSVNFRHPQQPEPAQQLISSLMGQIAQTNQGPSNHGGQAQGNNAISTLLASLLQGQTNNNAQNARNETARVLDDLLAQILQKSGEYLKHPPLDSPFDATIRTVLQLLQNHGTKPQPIAANQPQSFFAAPQQAQPPSTFPPAASMTSNGNANSNNDMISRLQAMLQGNNNQPQAQAPYTATASMLQQLLGQQGMGAQGGQGTSPQTQNAPAQPPAQQHPAPQQQHQQVPNIQDLLRIILQQQNQGGN